MLLMVGNFTSFTTNWSETAEFPYHVWLEGQSHLWSRRPLVAPRLLLSLCFSTVSEAAGTVPPVPLWYGPKWQHRA